VAIRWEEKVDVLRSMDKDGKQRTSLTDLNALIVYDPAVI
jgi:hypothetical protein